jgi:hypothetical protein
MATISVFRSHSFASQKEFRSSRVAMLLSIEISVFKVEKDSPNKRFIKNQNHD